MFEGKQRVCLGVFDKSKYFRLFDILFEWSLQIYSTVQRQKKFNPSKVQIETEIQSPPNDSNSKFKANWNSKFRSTSFSNNSKTQTKSTPRYLKANQNQSPNQEANLNRFQFKTNPLHLIHKLAKGRDKEGFLKFKRRRNPKIKNQQIQISNSERRLEKIWTPYG